MDSSFRIKIDFSSLNKSSLVNKTAWYLLNPTVCDNVEQLKRRICDWFEIETSSVLNEDVQVFLDNFLVPDKESVLLFKPNDLIVLRIRNNDVINHESKTESCHNNLGNEIKIHSKKCKRSKKRKRKDSDSVTIGYESDFKETNNESPAEENDLVTNENKRKKKKDVVETSIDVEEIDNKETRKKKKERHGDSKEPTDEDRREQSTSDDRCQDDHRPEEEEESDKDQRKKRKKRSKSVESENAEELSNEVSLNSENEVLEKKDVGQARKMRTRRRNLRKIRAKQIRRAAALAMEGRIENEMDKKDEEPKSRQSDDVSCSAGFVFTSDHETSSLKHIRFDDEDDSEQCNYIPKASVVTNGKLSKEETKNRSNENEVSRLKSRYRALLAERDVLTNKSTILTNPIEAETPCKKPNIDYLQYPLLEGPPRVNDIVAYKTLELSESYTPEVSHFKVAKVLQYDSESREVLLELKEPVSITNRRGKFELTTSNEEDLETEETLISEVTLQMSSFVEIRLVTDPM